MAGAQGKRAPEGGWLALFLVGVVTLVVAGIISLAERGCLGPGALLGASALRPIVAAIS